MSQLRAEVWCSAFVRRHNNLGTICVVSRRGDPLAGQIWVEIDHLDGRSSLYGPASALAYSETAEDRLFEPRLNQVETSKVRERMAQEANFDPDFWLIGVECRNTDVGLPLAKPTPEKYAPKDPFWKV